jgi:hypothetical protein
LFKGLLVFIVLTLEKNRVQESGMNERIGWYSGVLRPGPVSWTPECSTRKTKIGLFPGNAMKKGR